MCFPIVYPKAEVESPAISNCKLVQKKSEHKDSREDLMVDVDIVDRQQDDVSKPNHSVCGIIMKCIGEYYPRAKELFPDHERIRVAEKVREGTERYGKYNHVVVNLHVLVLITLIIQVISKEH